MINNYKPNKKSIKNHEVPDWFHDAKLGIFIHWGLFSVPAYAVTGKDLIENIKEGGFQEHFKTNPYAEWYLNSLRIEGSPTKKYHEETYGKDFEYDDFVPMFNEEIKKWDPNEMAKLFKKAGAKYVVLVTKHHDGFLLWPSDHPNPRKKNYHSSRDIVGELCDAVRKEEMVMGHYYSGTLDWSFNQEPITSMASFVNNGIMDPRYTKYANNHWYELIDKYDTMILWNDIGYPPDANIYEIFAHFYNKHPDGVINDRWDQLSKRIRNAVKKWPIRNIVEWAAKRAMVKGSTGGGIIGGSYDFKTPEYSQFSKISKDKWESTRGLGNSFGYNKLETDEDYLSSDDLIRMFVDVVSKNGNLLINVGPKADGTIPEPQKKTLLGLGNWLSVNGEAIYGTRPWSRAESMTTEGIQVRYTQNDEYLYVFILEKPKFPDILINDLVICRYADVKLLGKEEKLKWKQEGKRLKIYLPEDLPDFPVYTLSITPKFKK